MVALNILKHAYLDTNLTQQRGQLLGVYDQETKPVLDFYDSSIIREIDAIGSPADVLQHVLTVVVPVQNEHFRNPLGKKS